MSEQDSGPSQVPQLSNILGPSETQGTKASKTTSEKAKKQAEMLDTLSTTKSSSGTKGGPGQKTAGKQSVWQDGKGIQ